jgi:hypothetical protein
MTYAGHAGGAAGPIIMSTVSLNVRANARGKSGGFCCDGVVALFAPHSFALVPQPMCNARMQLRCAQTYVMMFAVIVEYGGMGIAAACGIAFVAVVVCVSLPMYAYISWRGRVRENHDALLGVRSPMHFTPRSRRRDGVATGQKCVGGDGGGVRARPIPVPVVTDDIADDSAELSCMSIVQTPMM